MSIWENVSKSEDVTRNKPAKRTVPEVAARDGTAVRMTSVLPCPLAVLSAELLPIIPAQHGLARHAEQLSLLRDTAFLAALPSLTAAALFATAGHTLLGGLFGNDYRGVLPILLVLSLSPLVNIVRGCAASTLMMTDDSAK